MGIIVGIIGIILGLALAKSGVTTGLLGLLAIIIYVIIGSMVEL